MCVIGPIDNVEEDEHEGEHFARHLVYLDGEDAVLQVAVRSETSESPEAATAAAAVAVSYAARQSPISAPKAVSGGAATESHLKCSDSVWFCHLN